MSLSTKLPPKPSPLTHSSSSSSLNTISTLSTSKPTNQSHHTRSSAANGTKVNSPSGSGISSSHSYNDFLSSIQKHAESPSAVASVAATTNQFLNSTSTLDVHSQGSNSNSTDTNGNENATSGSQQQQKMKLHVLIDGISPFVLKLNQLKTHHYLQIATQYYSELYDGKPPGPIFLSKAVHFSNGDKWFYFKRRATLQVKFQYEVQLRTPIYEELQACPESIVMGKNPSKLFLNAEEVLRVVSLNRLILLITDPWAPDYYVQVFWHTYSSFTDAKVVLEKFKERWFIPDLLKDQYNYSMQQEIFYNTVVKRKVKHRLASLFYHYVNRHYWHFTDEMVQSLESFCRQEIQSSFPTLSEKILKALAEKTRLPPWELYRQTKVPKNVGGASTSRTSRTTNILNIPVKDLAEQLTLMDLRFYNKIHYSEMLNQSWSKAKYRHRAPNLMDHINFLNHVSNWVAFIVVSEPNMNNRKKLIKRFIKTAEYLMKIRSYNMMMAVDSGLSSGPVYRLSLTWEDMDESVLAKREPIADVTSTSDNFKKFRAAMQQAYDQGEPCVPYSGVYLRDLVFTDDGNPTFIDGKVNFNKCIQTYNLFQLVLRFQGREYSFSDLPNLQQEIDQHEQCSKDELYEMSTEIQPRGMR